MRKMLLLLLLSAAAANATTRYVNNADATCGSHAPCYTSIQAALNAAVAGDDIRIQYGTGVYDEHAVAASSGSPGSPITIESDNASNQPALRYTGNGAVAAALQILDRCYWTIQNLTFDGTGVFTSTSGLWVGLSNTTIWTSGAACSGNSDLVGFRILNNTFKNWGGTEAQESSLSQRAQSAVTALLVSGGYGPPSPSSYTIKGTVIQGNRFIGNRLVAITMTSTKNSVVQNNDISNVQCGAQGSGAGGTAIVADGFHIISGTNGMGFGDIYKNNRIHDFQDPRQCGLQPSGAGAYNEWDGMHCDVGPHDSTIDSNLIYNIDPNNVRPGGGGTSTGLHIEAQCYGWTAKNNIIHDIGYSGILNNQQSGSGTRNLYYNNTIYNTKDNGIQLRWGYATVQNNIVDNAASVQIYVRSQAITAGNITINYNNYWDLSGGNKVGSWNEGAVSNFATWKANCGCDANSLSANPSLNNPGAGDFTETASSPTVDAGTTVSQVTTDFTGATFSQRDDIGAYEYGAGASSPSAPTNLNATVQ